MDPIYPLFYRDPVALSAERHGDLRLVGGDFAFAQETNATPLMAEEFALASVDFPIVFAGEAADPVAVLGLERSNLFVEEGRWEEGAYVPAYVRRFPFVFVEAKDDAFVLAADMASGRFETGGEAGQPIFMDGQPSALAKDALAFCTEMMSAHRMTKAFVSALREADLLIAQQADIRLPDGRPVKLGGMQIVDRERFAKLDDALVVDWHRKGWLALVHFHLASLGRFEALLALSARRSRAADTLDVN
jgi:hypothetical protein